jgi:hypothetical protein
MAKMVPRDVTQLKNPTTGEKALFNIIKSKLPDNWICYAIQKIAGGNRPDFLLIGPDLGILVVEEKSVSVNMIKSVNSKTWNIVREGKVIEEENPEEQARGYVLQAIGLLRSVARLRQDDGKLKFPYGQCVVFSNITKAEFKSSEIFDKPLSNIFKSRTVICKDDIPKEGEPNENFVNKFKETRMFTNFKNLDEKDIDAIRGAIFPEIKTRSIGDYLNDRNAELQALTIEQEQIARGIGKNDIIPHRLIRGVVGSGKSIVLRTRVKDVATDNPDWKILLTFFTNSLQGYLEKDMPANVRVQTIGSTLYGHWRKCNLDKKIFDPSDNAYAEICRQFQTGNLSRGEYDAIFVDEAQDLSPNQANYLRALLKEDTNCAMFAGDGVQNIFNKKLKTWKEHGFAIKGRSSKKEFCVNYRNTKEIYEFAQQYLRNIIDNFKALNTLQEETDYYKNIGFKRNGIPVSLNEFKSEKEECDYINYEIKRLIADNQTAPCSISILHPFFTENNPNYIYPYIEFFNKNSIPYYWISKNKETKRQYNQSINCVSICTPHSAKGLEWEIVFTPSLNKYYFENATSLAFVATTRAREILYPSVTLQ